MIFKKYFVIALDFDGSTSDMVTSISDKYFTEFSKGHYSFCFNADGHQKNEFWGKLSIHSSIELAEAFISKQQKVQYDTNLYFIDVGSTFDALALHRYLTKTFVMKELSKINLEKKGNGTVPNRNPKFGSN